MFYRISRGFRVVAIAAAAAVPLSAHALSFTEDYGGQTLTGVLNTTFTAGGAWRMQSRSADLVGKGNLNPNVCGGQLQSCQGVFRDQTAPAMALVAAPGAASLNGDDGNLNYASTTWFKAWPS